MIHHADQHKQQQQQQPRSIYGPFRYRDALGALLMAALVVGGYVVFRRVPMSVQRVAVYGPFEFIKREQVRAVVAPYVAIDLLQFPVASLRARLLSDLPWLKAVRVVRVWPPGIRLYLTERRAVAYWGGQRLLDASGTIFQPPHPWPKALPQFNGPADQAGHMLAFYEQVLHQDALAQHIQALEVSSRHAWQIRLDGGVLARLGRTHTEQRWQHFCQVYQLFSAQHHVPAEVVFDFRYPNGFSVGSERHEG